MWNYHNIANACFTQTGWHLPYRWAIGAKYFRRVQYTWIYGGSFKCELRMIDHHLRNVYKVRLPCNVVNQSPVYTTEWLILLSYMYWQVRREEATKRREAMGKIEKCASVASLQSFNLCPDHRRLPGPRRPAPHNSERSTSVLFSEVNVLQRAGSVRSTKDMGQNLIPITVSSPIRDTIATSRVQFSGEAVAPESRVESNTESTGSTRGLSKRTSATIKVWYILFIIQQGYRSVAFAGYFLEGVLTLYTQIFQGAKMSWFSYSLADLCIIEHLHFLGD